MAWMVLTARASPHTGLSQLHTMKLHSVFAFVLSVLAFILVPSAPGQIVFQDNFDNGLSDGNWMINKSGGDSDANFAYNYADIGIPSAPHSNGTTIGLRFLVN